MRTVTVRHRDFRGQVDYTIYETTEQLLVEKPQAKITDSLAHAVPGDYVIAQNGWIVPLISTTMIEDKSLRYGDRKPRKKVFIYKVFHFPKQKKPVRVESLYDAVFNYMPSTMDNFASEGKRCRMFELSAKKIQFAQLVTRGYDPWTATKLTYPNVRNTNKLLKSLLANDKLMNIITEQLGKTIRQELEETGLDSKYFAQKIKDLIDDRQAPPMLRKYALDTIFSVLKSDDISDKQSKEKKQAHIPLIDQVDMNEIRASIMGRNQSGVH